MIPAPFDYVRAESVDGALSLLAGHGNDAKVLAGGHSLLPLMKLRLAAPSVLIDIGRLRELSGVHVEDGELVIGALTRHAELVASPLVRAQAPLLACAASLVGDPQVRARGTIGGSLVHADPAADLPAAVLALDAALVLRGPQGTRTVAAAEFFTDFMQTALTARELLVAVRIPRGDGAWGYQKFVRRANDWAIVAVAASGGRVALAGMGERPVRAAACERALAGGASSAQAAGLVAEATSPVPDLHASIEYRRELARVLTRRALDGARGRA